MDAIWVVVISSVVPALIVLAGRWLDRRRGVPTEVDSAIDSHVSFVVESLKEEIVQRKQDAEDCHAALEAANKRIDALLKKIDNLERKIIRLQLKIKNGDEE